MSRFLDLIQARAEAVAKNRKVHVGCLGKIEWSQNFGVYRCTKCSHKVKREDISGPNEISKSCYMLDVNYLLNMLGKRGHEVRGKKPQNPESV